MNPKLTRIRQQFSDTGLGELDASLSKELEHLRPLIPHSASIAIAVGSRGIAHIAQIVKKVVTFVKDLGTSAFIVPAMGSHGGATAKGQAEVLAGYGITEQTVGAPIRSCMEVVELPGGKSSVELFMDRNAWQSDGVILINRIKPHTDYHGTYESGLAKMCVIGLGKHQQALGIHRFGVHGLRDLMPIAAKEILATGKILAGLAIVEDACDRIMLVRVLRADEVMAAEPELLETARESMPQLPTDKIDVLVVDRIGKDISGVGLDPNVIGRLRIRGELEPESPDIAAIVICDLTDESHGNALGMGLANVMTRKLYDKIDFRQLYENVYTSTFLERAKVPVVAETSKKAFDFALRSCGSVQCAGQRIVRIRDTLHLDELYVSQAILEELRQADDIDVIGPPVDLFDGRGELTSF